MNSIQYHTHKKKQNIAIIIAILTPAILINVIMTAMIIMTDIL